MNQQFACFTVFINTFTGTDYTFNVTMQEQGIQNVGVTIVISLKSCNVLATHWVALNWW